MSQKIMDNENNDAQLLDELLKRMHFHSKNKLYPVERVLPVAGSTVTSWKNLGRNEDKATTNVRQTYVRERISMTFGRSSDFILSICLD